MHRAHTRAPPLDSHMRRALLQDDADQCPVLDAQIDNMPDMEGYVRAKVDKVAETLADNEVGPDLAQRSRDRGLLA
jgi:hypothetical protein